MSIKLSIIVPIYNVERLIERCVRSLMEQTIKEGVEFVFINDGTPDNSMQILNRVISEYPDRKDQIRIFHNHKNLGISETRKRGIAEAQGEYIGWCDSDDWCELDMFEKLLAGTEDGRYDIVVCNAWLHKKVNGTENITFWEQKKSESPNEALMKIWNGSYFPWALWLQISKKKLIQKASNQIYPVPFAEDSFMLMFCFYYAKSALWLSETLYHYNLFDNGLSLVKQNYQTKENWDAQKKNIDAIVSLLSQDSHSEQFQLCMCYIKWHLKEKFKNSFDSIWQYWKTYHECYKYICLYTKTEPKYKLSVYLTYNFFPFYWLSQKKLHLKKHEESIGYHSSI